MLRHHGLLTVVGLNTLLRQGKPDRPLIEPTGFSHPKQILDILTGAAGEPRIVITARLTLCILDPRQLLDEKSRQQRQLPRSAGRGGMIIQANNKVDRANPESARALAGLGGSAGAASVARCRQSRAISI
ncbi:hypothetical protein MJ560_19645 [Klebsiella pneumoniae]|nr:hypothetical protein MJ560_19645 [Klebsiella pneumoniae]